MRNALVHIKCDLHIIITSPAGSLPCSDLTQVQLHIGAILEHSDVLPLIRAKKPTLFFFNSQRGDYFLHFNSCLLPYRNPNVFDKQRENETIAHSYATSVEIHKISMKRIFVQSVSFPIKQTATRCMHSDKF